MAQTAALLTRTALALGLSALASVAAAAPPGTLPYGAYDPGGDYADDPEVVIEHLFVPWQDVYLPSLVEADAYARERNRALKKKHPKLFRAGKYLVIAFVLWLIVLAPWPFFAR